MSDKVASAELKREILASAKRMLDQFDENTPLHNTYINIEHHSVEEAHDVFGHFSARFDTWTSLAEQSHACCDSPKPGLIYLGTEALGRHELRGDWGDL